MDNLLFSMSENNMISNVGESAVVAVKFFRSRLIFIPSESYREQ